MRNASGKKTHISTRQTHSAAIITRRMKQQGYLAIRAQSGIPGLPSTYGVAKDKMFYEPAEKGGFIGNSDTIISIASRVYVPYLEAFCYFSSIA